MFAYKTLGSEMEAQEPDGPSAGPGTAGPSIKPPTDAEVQLFSEYYCQELPRLVVFLMCQGAPQDLSTGISHQTLVELFAGWYNHADPRLWTRRNASRVLIRCLSDTNDQDVSTLSKKGARLLTEGAISLIDGTSVPAICALPARQRQVVAWFLDKWDTATIAGELGLEPKTVDGLFAEARDALMDGSGKS